MHITIYTSGTRGDIQPFIPLSEGLQRVGFKVRLATSSNFKELIEQAGIEFAPVELDYNELLLSPELQAAMEKGGVNFLLVMLKVLPRAFKMVERALIDAWYAGQGSEVVLFTANGAWGYHIAEALRIPAMYVCFQPLARSREVPNAVAMAKPRAAVLNWLGHIGFEYVTWLPLRSRINRWRRQLLHLPPLSLKPPFPSPQQITIGAYSPTLSPRPSDWPRSWQVVGAWLSDTPASWQPSADLAAFLEAGPPPVFLGFGSMITRDTARITQIVLDAIEQTRHRAVVTRGWNRLTPADVPKHVLLVEQVPHAWLFPRMAAIVHHGGSGTTAAALRSGVPSMAIPYGADQPFWGQRLYELGVGPAPVIYRDLTAERLAVAIQGITTNSVMRERAKAIGERIRAEDGVGKAVELIQKALQGQTTQ